MENKKVTTEEITAFLNGRDPLERIVSIECSYDTDSVSVIYVDDKGKTYLEYDLCPRAKTTELYEKSGTVLELYACLAAGEKGAPAVLIPDVPANVLAFRRSKGNDVVEVYANLSAKAVKLNVRGKEAILDPWGWIILGK